jgi:hypothetical protein
VAIGVVCIALEPRSPRGSEAALVVESLELAVALCILQRKQPELVDGPAAKPADNQPIICQCKSLAAISEQFRTFVCATTRVRRDVQSLSPIVVQQENLEIGQHLRAKLWTRARRAFSDCGSRCLQQQAAVWHYEYVDRFR